MSFRILNLVAAVVLVHAWAAAAQTGGVLSGVVRDGAGQPVHGVVLTVVGPTQPEARVVITDQRGVYFVDRLHYGAEYAVDVSHPRFRTSRLRASANEGEAPIDITLNPRRSRLTTVALSPWRLIRAALTAFPNP